MQEAAISMGNKRIGSLIVKEFDTPVGIVTERDLLSKVLAVGKNPSKEKVKTSMSYPLISISPTISIKEAAKEMIKKKGRLAVYDSGIMVGILTASDLIRSLPEAPETSVKVDDFMTKQVVTADENSTIDQLVKIMGEKRIGSVIITIKNVKKGIFTERDLLTTFLARKDSLKVTVRNFYSTPLITVNTETSIHDAAVTMAMKQVRRLPIIKRNKMIGIITARDLVEAYAQ
jgi:CBS domain-containing protein